MKKVIQVDRDPASPSISVGGVKQKQNFCGGILGIVFWILLAILFVKKSITVVGKKEVTVQTFIQKDQSQLQIDIDDMTLAVLVIQETAQGNIPISYDMQNQYGFQTIFVEYFVWWDEEEQRVKNDVKLAPMIACPDDGDVFCIPPSFKILKIECEIERVGPFGCNQTRYYDILIRKCNPNAVPNCSEQIQPNLMASMFFFNNKFDVYQPKTSEVMDIQNKAFFLSGAQFDEQDQYVFRVYFSKLQIQTDQSILPVLIPIHTANNIYSWFYPNQDLSFLDYFRYSKHRYVTIQLRRSYETQRYRRNFLKVDTMLAQILGFMGLIAWLISICCSGYNQYLMEEYVIRKKQEYSKYSTNHQNQEQTEEEEPRRKPGFLDYCKYRVSGICGNNRLHYQHQKEIDVLGLYRKVQSLEFQVNQIKSEKALPKNSPPFLKTVPTPNKPNINVSEAALKESLLSQQEKEEKK